MLTRGKAEFPCQVLKQDKQPHRYRTIWLSDVHLGTRAQGQHLVDFLKRN